MELSLMGDMKANSFPVSLTHANGLSNCSFFHSLLMTCCNGDGCSVHSNAIFWQRSCEKGNLLNAVQRKLFFSENRNSSSTINLRFFSSHYTYYGLVIVQGTEIKQRGVRTHSAELQE